MKKNRSRILIRLVACLVACDVSLTFFPLNVFAKELENADADADITETDAEKADTTKKNATEMDADKADAEENDSEEAGEDEALEEIIVYQDIEINSADDFIKFAKKCNVNSWSRDKSVSLNTDINLEELDFEPIPFFDGVFKGNQHKITGFENTDDTYISGFIRYIGVNGLVQDLDLIGEIKMEDDRKYTGGLCGQNHGIIKNCSYSGIMEGNNTVGPIAAINENTGLISNCKNNAYVSGYYFTGGIAGKNYGIISGCTNDGNINNNEEWVIKDDEKGGSIIQQISKGDIEEHNVLMSGIDVGGIAGYSKGSILRCTNVGTIGYEHVGYNIGGIAGRQMGIVSYCTNKGNVYGRKDIGGIVGQMEPYLEPEDMQTLPEAADTLHDLVDKTINDMDGSVDTISSDITDLTTYADGVVDDGYVLTGELTTSINTNIGVINEVIARLEYIMDSLPSVINNITNANESLGYFNQAVARAVEAINTDDELSDYDRELIYQSQNDMYSGLKSANDRADEIEGLIDNINALMYETDGNGDYVYNEDGTRKIKVLSEEEQALLNSHMAQLQQITATSGSDLSGMMGNVSNILETYKPYADTSTDAVIGNINDAVGALQSAQGSFNEAGRSARSMLDYLNSQSDLRLSGLSSTWDNSLNSLHSNLRGITGSLENMNVDGKASSHTLNEDFSAVNDQINVIYHIISDRLDIIVNDDAEIFTDISDEEIKQARTGRVDSSKNTGTIDGDINIGGIAGSMAIDEEDPEENAAGNIDRGAGSKYTLKNIICDCTDDSTVRAKKDGAGLIVGYMAHGIVTSCLGIGSVSSTEGSYTGGIAGESLSIIRDCDSLCLLGCKKYVGGITGYGTTVSGCLTIPTWDDVPEERFGAVVGSANTDSDTQAAKMANIKDNYFLEGAIAGIDNISYTAVAEPLGYNDLINHEGASSEFRHLKVRFEVDDEMLGEQELKYGESLSNISFPDGPYKDGFYIEWPDVSDMVMNGNYVITGEYKVTQKSVESSDTFEDSGKTLALMGGSYGSDAQISARIVDEPSYTPINTLTEHEHKIYQVAISEGKISQDTEKKLRLYNPYKEAVVKKYSEGKWVKVASNKVGSYLEIPMEANEGIYAIVEYNNLPLKIAVVIIFVIVLIVLFLIRKLIKRIIRRIKELMERKKSSKKK